MVSPNTLVASITAAAIALAEGKSSDQISLMAAVFTQFGDTLATINTQRDICNMRKEACQEKMDTKNW